MDDLVAPARPETRVGGARVTSERERLAERRDLVVRDMDELSEQVENGEIDEETAAELRAAYQEELSAVDSALEALPAEVPQVAVPSRPKAQSAKPGRSPRRVLVGGLLLIAALTAAIAFAARDTGTAGPSPAAGAPGELTVDPNNVTNDQLEAVVAANPEIIGMRMALADRYFASENYSAALDHYLYIAENATSAIEESKALARIGWAAYAGGLPEAAAEYITAALNADPTNGEAVLFRGFVTLYGLGDAEAAIPQLEAALAMSGLSENNIAQLEAAIEDAQSGDTP